MSFFLQVEQTVDCCSVCGDICLVLKQREMFVFCSLKIPDPSNAVEFKKGYVMRKCCLEPDGRKSKSFCIFSNVNTGLRFYWPS